MGKSTQSCWQYDRNLHSLISETNLKSKGSHKTKVLTAQTLVRAVATIIAAIADEFLVNAHFVLTLEFVCSAARRNSTSRVVFITLIQAIRFAVACQVLVNAVKVMQTLEMIRRAKFLRGHCRENKMKKDSKR
jgi:hypothetical protein